MRIWAGAIRGSRLYWCEGGGQRLKPRSVRLPDTARLKACPDTNHSTAEACSDTNHSAVGALPNDKPSRIPGTREVCSVTRAEPGSSRLRFGRRDNRVRDYRGRLWSRKDRCWCD